MTREELADANGILNVILDTLLTTLRGGSSRQQATAKNTIGFLRAAAAANVTSNDIGSDLFDCFESCRKAGANRGDMDTVRRAMLTTAPATLPGVSVAVAGIHFSLIEQATILTQTTFVSREDVDAMIVTMNGEFEPVEEFIADYSDDPNLFQAVLSLHAAVTQDLSARARPLPRMVNYNFASRMPSLVLANRIYADAGRGDELRKENKTVHPAFMQAKGRCLSA